MSLGRRDAAAVTHQVFTRSRQYTATVASQDTATTEDHCTLLSGMRLPR